MASICGACRSAPNLGGVVITPKPQRLLGWPCSTFFARSGTSAFRSNIVRNRCHSGRQQPCPAVAPGKSQQDFSPPRAGEHSAGASVALGDPRIGPMTLGTILLIILVIALLGGFSG